MPSPPSAKLANGTVLAGKYRITRELGRGGMAAVYEAENVDIGKRVAIKVLAQELTASSVVVERFLREARAAAAIRSPHICDVYDSGRLEDGRPFLVLELLHGESLYERMTRVRLLDAATTIQVISQVCRGLTKAHAANIVHRDLKPENIFLTKDEEGRLLAKILDFGLAKFYVTNDGEAQGPRLTREGAVFGTPAYMSPEQVRGQGAVDHRADLWALGCIVYECLTGRTVWNTEQGVAMTFAQIANAKLPDPLKYRPGLPPSFVAWFQRALARDIAQRFTSARELAEELSQSFAQGKPSFSAIHVPSPPPSQKTTSEPELEPMDRLSDLPPSGLAASQGEDKAREGSAASVEIPVVTPPVPSARREAEPPVASGPSPAGPKPSRGSGGRVVLGVALAAVASAGVYAGYRQLGPRPTAPAPSSTATATASAATVAATTASATSAASVAPSASPTGVATASPSATAPWQPLVSKGQEALAAGDLKSASALFKEALEKSGHGVPRNMHEHVQVALAGAAPGAPCGLRGLYRPRTHDLRMAPPIRRAHAGRPTLALGEKGPLVAWTDSHEGGEHVWVTLLGGGGEPIDATPEASAVTRPELIAAGKKIALAYVETRSAKPGLYVRWLEPDGTIAGSPQLVAPSRGATHATVTRAGEGFVAVWTQMAEGDDSEDLFLRVLGPGFETKSEPLRLTDYVALGPGKPRVRSPALAFQGAPVDRMHVAYRFEREPERSIQHAVLDLAKLPASLPEPDPKARARSDKLALAPAALNTDRSKGDNPSAACGADGCLVVWHVESGTGQSLAYLDGKTGQVLWRKNWVGKSPSRPAVGASAQAGGDLAVSWLEAGRMSFALADKKGVSNAPIRFARVSGEQPPPHVVSTGKKGEWLVAWLDFEASFLEPYVARIGCAP
jgi:serine/threonine protein kinase